MKETVKELEGVATTTWDEITKRTGLERDAVKAFMFCVLCDGPVIGICKKYKLSTWKCLEIRNVFDEIMERGL